MFPCCFSKVARLASTSHLLIQESVTVLWATANTYRADRQTDRQLRVWRSTLLSCVRTSAFLHVFYVSYTFVNFPCRLYVCTYAHMCVSVACSVYVCERVCCCLCSLFKMMFSIWEAGSEKVILWETVCAREVELFKFKPQVFKIFTAFPDESTQTKVSQSITLRGRDRKCYILLMLCFF